MKKVFEIKSPEEIPPESIQDENKKNLFSDLFFGLAENDKREQRKYVVYYDFQSKVWKFVGGFGGKKKLIEYYV